MSELSGHIYNVGGGKKLSVSLCELTELCRKVTGNQIRIDSVRENRNADIPCYISDCWKISNRVGWQPMISLEQIIAEIADWTKDNEQLLKAILN